VKTMEKHAKEKTLFYTQEVDEKVVEHVKADQSIEGGIRDGNKVFITKIPYETKLWYEATDEKQKIYHMCHNPWIREAILENHDEIPTCICNASGGYYKNFWEAVLGEEVEVELLESPLTGGEKCKFILHLPEGIVKD
ncbi:MAG: hypothetical protein KAR35_11085, partial [Candidatus Heimdallarchaeota archaeon]|nr:hypothetical protein [Candidatus Heimdallarchaeota archaeon]MCK5049904.1 hypothetical protein [Candidatus Heimdallarchaeota archaeon]